MPFSSLQRSLGSLALALTFVLGVFAPLEAGPDSGLFVAQAQPARPRGNLRLDRGTTRKATPTNSTEKAGAPSPAGEDAEKTAENSEEAATESKGFVASLRGWIRGNAALIVSVLAFAIIGIFLWVFMGRSRSNIGENVFAPLDEEVDSDGAPGKAGRRYSTTRIHARDVNARLESTEVDSDRDYALVVDKDALKMPEIDESTGRVYEDSAQIERLIDDQKFDEAYEAYIERVDEDGNAEFHKDLERTLGEHYLQQKTFDRATRVFEHHVATHSATDVEAATYFNLGYLHFFGKRTKKSRRFFKLYVENEPNSSRADRARKILKQLETSGPLS